jgi:hypothetical protein
MKNKKRTKKQNIKNKVPKCRGSIFAWVKKQLEDLEKLEKDSRGCNYQFD